MYTLRRDFYPDRAEALMVKRHEMRHLERWIEGVYRRIAQGKTPPDLQEQIEKEQRLPDRGSPDRTYLICYINRSGSSLLGRCVAQTAKLGHPHEWLNPEPGHAVESLSARLGARSFPEYLERLLAKRQTANKVFGTKISYMQLVYMHETGLLRAFFCCGSSPIRHSSWSPGATC